MPRRTPPARLLALLVAASAAPAGAPADAAEGVPKVALSEQHRAMCRVGVGDPMPLLGDGAPLLKTPNGDPQPLGPLLGKRATLVVFYTPPKQAAAGWMTRMLLADLGPDVAQRFGAAGVAVVAIATGGPPPPAEGYYSLVDPDGAALATVAAQAEGRSKLPRLYLLDSAGKIRWLDIEYAMSTRRELRQALTALTAEPVAE
ncbi:MAG: hypothetical protein AAF790_00805 [Planctomycetota bacterium]